jgi:hypothetical protein
VYRPPPLAARIIASILPGNVIKRKMMALALAVAAGGCVERTLTITSNPTGALVYLNDQEIGRTPIKRDFLWYGNYDVALRKEGYEAVKTQQNVRAPIYQIVPLDLFAELLPFHYHDEQTFNYTMTPLSPADPQAMLQHAAELKAQLEPSKLPRTAKTAPATQPAR